MRLPPSPRRSRETIHFRSLRLTHTKNRLAQLGLSELPNVAFGDAPHGWGKNCESPGECRVFSTIGHRDVSRSKRRITRKRGLCKANRRVLGNSSSRRSVPVCQKTSRSENCKWRSVLATLLVITPKLPFPP